MSCSCLDCESINVPQGSQGATGPTGPAGSNGTDGVNGVAVLHNDISNSVTTGTSLEILKSYTIPANELSTDGSYLTVLARCKTTTATDSFSTKNVGVYFNGSVMAEVTFVVDNVSAVEFEILINRFSNTVVKIKSNYQTLYSFIPQVNYNIRTPFVQTGGLNLTTTTYDITVKANSDVIGDLTCENLTILKYKK